MHALYWKLFQPLSNRLAVISLLVLEEGMRDSVKGPSWYSCITTNMHLNVTIVGQVYKDSLKYG